MATVVDDGLGGVQQPRAKRKRVHWGIALIALLLLAAALRFVDRSVVPYYLHYSAEQFGPYWPKRFGILAHMSFGTFALLVGPFQLWSGFRRRYPVVHRWLGRAFIVTCLISACFAFYMALTPTFGWTYGLGLMGLGGTWVGCALMGYFSIGYSTVVLHRRWMIRTYVITFAFVTFRLFTDLLGWANFGTVEDIQKAAAWVCWSIPLAVTILVEGVSDIRNSRRKRPRA
jgi:hypothetical protein